MYRTSKFAVPFVTLIAMGVSASAWAQGRGREGRVERGRETGRGGEIRQRVDSDKGVDARVRGESAPRGRVESAPRVEKHERAARDMQRSEKKTELPEMRGDARREVESRRDRDSARHESRDDGWRHRHRRDRDHDYDDDDDFSFGFQLGPISGHYGPWYRYYGPWYGFYGPSYGYYGPWSGYYGRGWPYYYGETIIGSYNDGGRVPADSDESAAPMRRQRMMTPEGLSYQRRAEEAFRRGQYDEAVRLANHAAVEMPDNGRLFLFLAQALFAVGDYGVAAGALHQGMEMSDPDEWGTIVEDFRWVYGNVNDYTDQLRRLEKFVGENPEAPYARFLVGFQYGYLGHQEHARRELAKAVELEDRDELARELLAEFGGEMPDDLSDDRNREARPERPGDAVERTARQEGRGQGTQRNGGPPMDRDDRAAPPNDADQGGAPESSTKSNEESAPPPE